MVAGTIITPSIVGYLIFLITETLSYIYLAVAYHKRMHEDSWDSNVPAERFILFCLWLSAVFCTILTATNLHTVITLNAWVYVHHLVTIMNATKRSLTLGVTVLLSSGRNLSKKLALFMIGYATIYVGISKYMSWYRRSHPFDDKLFIAYVWPTGVDLIIYGYSLHKLQETIQTLEVSNQTRKLTRYVWLRYLLCFVGVFLLCKQLLIVFTTLGPVEAEMDQTAFFLTLAGIGFLWQPSPANRDFANVVELLPADLELESPFLTTAKPSDGE